MLDEVRKQLTSVNILVTLLIIAVGIYLFQIAWQVLGIFSDVIIIVFLAWILSFVLEPGVVQLGHIFKLNRIVSASVVYALLFGLITVTVILFIPAVSSQTENLSKILPHYLSSSPQFLNRVSNTVLSYLESSLSYLPSVAGDLFYAFLILIISFYLVIDKEKFQKELYSTTPKKWHPHIQFTQDIVESTFGSYLRIQLLIGVIAGVVTWIVLQIAGIQFAASTAVVAGLLTTIPLLGPALGITPPVLIAFLTNPLKGLIIFLVLIIFQQILFNVIAPRLLGKVFKMHPIVVLLSFIVGYKVFGAIGAVFSVPLLGILLVVIHRLSRHFIAGEK